MNTDLTTSGQTSHKPLGVSKTTNSNITLQLRMVLVAGLVVFLAFIAYTMLRPTSNTLEGTKLTIVYQDGWVRPMLELKQVAANTKAIDIYTDFGCPNCQTAHQNLATKLEQLQSSYTIRHHYLVSRAHPTALFVTEFRRCLPVSSKTFDDFAFANQNKWMAFTTQAQFNSFATQAGYAVRPACTGQKTPEQYRKELNTVLDKGINATPTFEILGWRTLGTLTSLGLETILNNKNVSQGNTDCQAIVSTCQLK
jgi:hypothetical protein